MMKPLDHDLVAVALLGRSAAMLRRLRRHATMHLTDACAASGITPTDMEDNDRAVVACLVLSKARGKRSDRQAAALLRWCIVAEEHGIDDRAIVRIQQALRGLDAEVQADQQDAARDASKAARQVQADADAERVAGFFASAWRPGMGRTVLQATAVGVLRQAEQREQDRLATMQQAGNRHGARQASAALAALQRQSALLTLHRAGKWLQSHHPPPAGERQ